MWRWIECSGQKKRIHVAEPKFIHKKHLNLISEPSQSHCLDFLLDINMCPQGKSTLISKHVALIKS